MKVEIIVDDRLVALGRAFSSRRAAAALSFVLVFGLALVSADPLGRVPHEFLSGDVVSAEKMNENFEELVDAVDAVDAELVAEADALRGEISAVEQQVGVVASGLTAVEGSVSSLQSFTARIVMGDQTGSLSCDRWCRQNAGDGSVCLGAHYNNTPGDTSNHLNCDVWPQNFATCVCMSP